MKRLFQTTFRETRRTRLSPCLLQFCGQSYVVQSRREFSGKFRFADSWKRNSYSLYISSLAKLSTAAPILQKDDSDEDLWFDSDSEHSDNDSDSDNDNEFDADNDTKSDATFSGGRLIKGSKVKAEECNEKLSDWDSRLYSAVRHSTEPTVSGIYSTDTSEDNLVVTAAVIRRQRSGEVSATRLYTANNTPARISKADTTPTLFDFSDFGLRSKLEQRLVETRLVPLPIQSVVFGAVRKMQQSSDGRSDDCGVNGSIICSPMGSGKTLAFLLPALDALDPMRCNQVVVVAPTNELCEQIKSMTRALLAGRRSAKHGKHGADYVSQQMIKARANEKQRARLDAQSPLTNRGTVVCAKSSDPLDYTVDLIEALKPSIIVGTPKRLRELFLEKVLTSRRVDYLIFDECDSLFEVKGKHVHRSPQKMRKRKHEKPAALLLQGIIKQQGSLEKDGGRGFRSRKSGQVLREGSCHVMFVGATVPKQLKNSLSQLMLPFPLQDISLLPSATTAATAASRTSASLAQSSALEEGQSESSRTFNRHLSSGIYHQYIPVHDDDNKFEVIADLVEQLRKQFDRAVKRLDEKNEAEDEKKQKELMSSEKTEKKSRRSKKKKGTEEETQVEGSGRVQQRRKPPGVLIFVRKETSPIGFAEKLSEAAIGNLKVAVLHEFAGDRSARAHFLKELRSGNVECAVASESIARGLDLIWLEHVIIAEMPLRSASYLHMCGRVGRLGANGFVTSVCHSEDEIRLQFHVNRLGIDVQKLNLLQDTAAFGFQHSWQKLDSRRLLQANGVEKAFPLLCEAQRHSKLFFEASGKQSLIEPKHEQYKKRKRTEAQQMEAKFVVQLESERADDHLELDKTECL